MSIQVMNAVWGYADCKGSELLILLAMADFADDDGRNIFPSMQTLGRKARLSEPQARRVVQSLVKKNLVEVVEVGGWNGKRNQSNSYRIILENLGGGIKLIPPPSRTYDHRGRADDITVVSSTRDDPSYNRVRKSPVKDKRPQRAQRRKKYSEYPDDDDPEQRRRYRLDPDD